MLHENGVKPTMIRKITDRGIQTISLVVQAGGDHKKYRQLMSDFSAKYNRKNVVKPTPETPDLFTQNEGSLDQWNTVIALLKAIEFNQQKEVTLLERIYEKSMQENTESGPTV